MGQRTSLLAIAIALGLLLAGCSGTRQVEGDGVLYGQMDCLSIRFDDGQSYPIADWPEGYSVRYSPSASPKRVLLDASGRVVLREGQRVNARVSVRDVSGETRCLESPEGTVLEFRSLADPTQSP